jgi:hypothetical protein
LQCERACLQILEDEGFRNIVLRRFNNGENYAELFENNRHPAKRLLDMAKAHKTACAWILENKECLNIILNHDDANKDKKPAGCLRDIATKHGLQGILDINERPSEEPRSLSLSLRVG